MEMAGVLMSQNIHWFPGHMQKALRKISETIKIVDVVIELSDARAYKSSRNQILKSLIGNKPHLLILTKADLADEAKLATLTTNNNIMTGNLFDPQFIRAIRTRLHELGAPLFKRQQERGMKPQPLNALVVGIPNVGKSTFINSMARARRASVANRPGHTRGHQYIKVDDKLALIDTPGVLEPQYEDKTVTMHLALIGTIRAEILPTNKMADYLLTYLKTNYPALLKTRYGINEVHSENYLLLKSIAAARNFVGAEDDVLNRTELMLLHEFKNGLIGKVSFE